MQAAIKTLVNLFERADAADYVGEPVSQAGHALQAAALASASGDVELLLAALLHDVGHLCFADAEQMDNVGTLEHEMLGADFLTALGFSRRVTSLVAGHVDAKRYLCAVEPDYFDALSPASVRSLELQGGLMLAEELEAFENGPDFSAAVALRRWDEGAKISGAHTPDFAYYLFHISASLNG